MKKMKRIAWLACIAFAVAVAAILWITLISRTQNETPLILPPLWSYREIAGGNKRILLECILNVFLFLPVGLFLPALWKTKGIQVVCIAFLGSAFIEVTQLFWKLGYCEADDLLHNTLGALLGFWIYHACGIPSLPISRKDSLRFFAVALALMTGLCVLGQRTYTDYYARQMRILASMNDRADTPNLLVLNGKNGYAGKSEVYVRYLKDGSISISGTSDVRGWKLLGELELEAGHYSFTGLSGVEEKTVAIELLYYSTEKEKFTRLTKDIGSVETDYFQLQTKTRIRAYVSVYSGCECDVIARPAIYREED